LKITILGDGGWGTALALTLDQQGKKVCLWSAFPEYAEELKTKRENVKFLPGFSLPESIEISSSLEEAIQYGEIIISAVPTQFLRNVLYKCNESWFYEKTIVSVSKGIENKSHLRPSEIILSHFPKAKLVVLSGPSHAEEVVKGVPTCLVAASANETLAQFIQSNLSDDHVRIYTSTDVAGTELGGAFKNVIALGVGILNGLELGDNAKAALMTRGMIEMARLGISMGAEARTFFGLSGIGDLITTCFSPYGRNLRVGTLIGQGKKLEEIIKSMDMVAEGVATTEAAMDLSKKHKVELPITQEIHAVLFEGKSPKDAVASLMNRKIRPEFIVTQPAR